VRKSLATSACLCLNHLALVRHKSLACVLSLSWLELGSGTLLAGERVLHPKEPGQPRPDEPWQGLVPRCAVQSCSRAAKCLAGCFPLGPGTLRVGLCYSVALLRFLIGHPLRPLHPIPPLGQAQSPKGHRQQQAEPWRLLQGEGGERGLQLATSSRGCCELGCFSFNPGACPVSQ